MDLELSVDMRGARQAVKRAPGAMIDAIEQTLLQVAIYTQWCFRKNIPFGKTGSLARNVNYIKVSRVEYRVEPTDEYADYVEFGTRPHFPPVDAITPWARMRGINPWALAHSIAKHGTAPHPYLEKTYKEVEPYANRLLAHNVQEVIDKVI